MADDQDKKISYKILTAEEILKDTSTPAKQIEHREEKIEVPVTGTIEEKTKASIPEKIEIKTEVIKTDQKESGVLYPEPKEEIISVPESNSQPFELQNIGESFEIKGPQSIIDKSVETIGEEQLTSGVSETKVQEETQVDKKESKEIFYFQPKEELSSIETKGSQIIEQREKTKIKLNYTYFLIPAGLIIILAVIFFLKPHEKIMAFFQSKKTQKNVVAKPSTSKIVFPTVTSTLVRQQKIQLPIVETTTSQVSSTITATTATQSESEIASTKIVFPTTTSIVVNNEELVSTSMTSSQQEVALATTAEPMTKISSELENQILPTKEIVLPGESQTIPKDEFDLFLSKQNLFGTKINLKFIDNNQKVSVDFLFDYFIKSKKSQELKNELTGNYGLLIYYGYTRKYPVLIFEIKNKNKVLKFNQNWEAANMKNDLQTLFLGYKPPATKNTFQTKKADNFSYRILNFGDNYKIIWAIINNYLIYSSTETGLKEVIPYLR